jgi:uncharacterized membrane protein required for colicin V production
MVEIGISVALIAAILFIGRNGLEKGFFVQVTTTGIVFFAMLVALRYWYPFATWLGASLGTGEAQNAFGAFWILFIFVFAPCYALLRSLNERIVPVYPLVIERGGGFLAGCASGVLVTGCIIVSLSLYLPKMLPEFDNSRLLLPIDRAPIAIYRGVESLASRGGWSMNEHMVFPELSKSNGKLEATWK